MKTLGIAIVTCLLAISYAQAGWNIGLITGVAGDDGDDGMDPFIFPLLEYEGENFTAGLTEFTYHAIDEDTYSLDIGLSVDFEELFEDDDDSLGLYSEVSQNKQLGLVGFSGGLVTGLSDPLDRNVVSVGVNTFLPLGIVFIPSLKANWHQEGQARIRFEDDSISSVTTYSAELVALIPISEQLTSMLIFSAEQFPDEVQDLEDIDYEREYAVLGIISYSF